MKDWKQILNICICHNWTITHHVNMKRSSWWCYHIFPADVLTYCNSGSLLALNAVTVAAIGVNVSQCHVIFSSRKHSFGKGQKMWPWADASVLQQCWAVVFRICNTDFYYHESRFIWWLFFWALWYCSLALLLAFIYETPYTWASSESKIKFRNINKWQIFMQEKKKIRTLTPFLNCTTKRNMVTNTHSLLFGRELKILLFFHHFIPC